MPTIAVKIPAIASTAQIDRWMPGASGLIPVEPKWSCVWLKCCDANQPAT